MSRPFLSLRALLAGATLTGALALGACSSESEPGDGALVDQAALDAAIVNEEEIELGVEAMQGVGFALMPMTQSSAPGGMAHLMVPRPLCATVSRTADTDGDGIRDSTTFTYALPACEFTNLRGGTLQFTGKIFVTDPDPAPAFAYKLEYGDFRMAFTAANPSLSWSATRNGARQLSATAAGLALSNTVSVVRTFPRGEGSAAHNTLLTFTPAAGASLVRGEPLPAGSFTLDGTVNFTRNGAQRTLTIQTVTPLAYDPACETAPRLTAGEIRLVRPDGSFVRVTWTGCGIPATREYVPAAS